MSRRTKIILRVFWGMVAIAIIVCFVLLTNKKQPAGYLGQQLKVVFTSSDYPYLKLYEAFDHIYWATCTNPETNPNCLQLTDIDPATFERVNNLFVKDKNNVWVVSDQIWQLTVKPPVDVASFTAVDKDFVALGKDKYSYIYYSNERTTGPSLNAKYLGAHFFQNPDGRIFQYTSYGHFAEVPELTGKSIHPISWQYVSYDNRVFWVSSPFHEIAGADADTFKPVTYPNQTKALYAADKLHAYYLGNLIDESDGKSFVVIPFEGNSTYASDDICGFSFSKDRNHVYLNGKEIGGADPSSFHVINQGLWGLGCSDSAYSVDAHSAYYNGQAIVNSDPASFTYVGGEYAKDKNHFYKNGISISNDPKKTEQELRDAGTFKISKEG